MKPPPFELLIVFFFKIRYSVVHRGIYDLFEPMVQLFV